MREDVAYYEANQLFLLKHGIHLNLRRKMNTHVQQAHPDQDGARDVSSGCLLYAGARVLLWLPGEIYAGPVGHLVSCMVMQDSGRGSW
jgi:hypothetical protein